MAPELGTATRIRRDPAGDVRGTGFRPRGRGGRGRGGGKGLLVLLVVLAVLGIGTYLLLPAALGGVFRTLANENPDWLRLPFVADAVREEVEPRLDQPAGTDPTQVDFVIPSGASARQITDDLVQRGLVTDQLAFSWILIVEGAGSSLQAGNHVLDRTMSPREVAFALQATPQAPGNDRLTVALRDGLRIEQVTAYLVRETWTAFDPAEFFELAISPPAELRADYPMLDAIPEGRSVEGFLGLGIFEVERDIDAEGFLRVLLERRAAEIDGLLAGQPPAILEDFYEVMIVASIVEAEAPVEAERPLVAGVYLNRLDSSIWITRLLNADPTVVYGNDSVNLRALPIDEWDTYSFWGPPGRPMADVELEGDLAGFQTYRLRGLPPGPIRSPSVSSIQAVFEPDQQEGYLYFVAKGDGTRTHAFATTFEEHLANIDRYQRGGGEE